MTSGGGGFVEAVHEAPKHQKNHRSKYFYLDKYGGFFPATDPFVRFMFAKWQSK
jgi:hypothetical protein